MTESWSVVWPVVVALGDVVRLGESLGDVVVVSCVVWPVVVSLEDVVGLGESLGDVVIVAWSVVWWVVVGVPSAVEGVVGLGESLGDVVDVVGRAHTQLNLHRHAPAPVL